MTYLSVVVPGVPQPQGSIRSLGRGRPSVHSNADRLLPWRASLIGHLRQAMNADPAATPFPISGPVQVDVQFTLPKPKSAPKSRRFPDRKPDLDKLVRAALDSLGCGVGAGVIFDDAQVVMVTAEKRYGDPGCRITLNELPAEPAEAAA